MFQVSEAKETNRIEAFSDGVFAIAITLLALDLKAPKHAEVGSGEALVGALIRQWPSYMAFLFSFLTILVMWVNHHRAFRMLRKVDGWLMAANGLVLLVITAVPFPTAVLAEHYMDSGAAVATAFYAVSSDNYFSPPCVLPHGKMLPCGTANTTVVDSQRMLPVAGSAAYINSQGRGERNLPALLPLGLFRTARFGYVH